MITVQMKLLPTLDQNILLLATTNEYIKAVNNTVAKFVEAGTKLKYSSKDVMGILPSALKGQIVLDAISIYQKYKKTVRANERKEIIKQSVITIPILKKPIAIWNNQNWKLKENTIRVPVMIEGKSCIIAIPVIMTKYQYNKLNGKLGALRITQKNGKWIAQIAVDLSNSVKNGTSVVGIDLGLKVPAVAISDVGNVHFFGNGRQNKYIKRKFRSNRWKLGKAKKLNAIKKSKDKEQRWMKDQDHKISRQLINFAIKQNAHIIRLEKLSGIRQTARTSRKNEKNLHTWSFYRLAQYIEYKANMAGIKVEYVSPKYTSQICPVCGEKNKAKDRKYQCKCGFQKHRDIVGAMNIIKAPVIDGKSQSA